MSKYHTHAGVSGSHLVTTKHKDRVAINAHNKALGKTSLVPKKQKQETLKTVSPSRQTISKDHGTAPSQVETYEPIVDFDPNNAPSGYIIVKMNHDLLDDMLQKMTRKQGAIAVGVPCRKI